MALTENTRPQPIASSRLGSLALAGGDALAFLAFAAIGRSSHGEAAGLAALLQVAETAAPFAIGWFLVAPLAGALRAGALAEPRRLLARTALAWLLAWPIGLGLRALIRQSGIPISFAIVTLVTVLAILLIWRGALALLVRATAR